PLCSTPSRSLRSLHWGLLGVKRLWALPAYLHILHYLKISAGGPKGTSSL
ncbi:hypothetical protein M2137_001975, partial [Parabacteroides sp. PFB2-10]|nr:hypothetical protein [Parabacteroides sp. PFB2-10]